MSIVLFIFVELISAFLIITRIVPDRYPSYRFRNITDNFYTPHKIFGVWHSPNSNYRRDIMTKVICKANSYGAADIERKKLNASSKKRILVLGDSFVEGKGVNQRHRYTNRLESHTGLEHLNFG